MSGTVSNGKAGETVTIVADPTGQPATRTDVTTTTDGAWRLVVRPHILTAFRAQWAEAAGSAVSVKVRPRVTLRKVAARRFATSVIAADAHAGRAVTLRRWSIPLRRWLLVKRAVLCRSPVDENVAVTSFRVRIKKGRKLRVFIAQSQVLPGYVAGHSNFIVN